MADDDTPVKLARIEVKVDQLADHMKMLVQDHEIRIRKLESHNTGSHEERIAANEKWRYMLPASVFGTVISAALFIWKMVSGQ